jgi:hypothetical protein
MRAIEYESTGYLLSLWEIMLAMTVTIDLKRAIKDNTFNVG